MACEQDVSKALPGEHSLPADAAARFGRPSTNLVGGTQPHPDDIRHVLPPEEESAADFAARQRLRFSRPSANLVGGIQPHPDDIRRPLPQEAENTAAFAVRQRLRFSRPSTNLEGGTQPVIEDIRHHPGQRSLPELFTIQQPAADSPDFSIPPPPASPLPSGWLGLERSICVAGLELPDGLIYIGMNDPAFQQAEPSFIDISLPVSSEPVDIEARLTGYWPAYGSLTPQARRGYLQWLAGGRSAAQVNPGYVFLFFYGLERRAVLDAATDMGAQADIPAITSEVQRLQALYGADASIRSYTARLLDHLQLGEISDSLYQGDPPVFQTAGYDMPPPLRIGLGQMAAASQPMNAQWALAWVLADPLVSRRTPVSRCPELFMRLFRNTFTERFPGGLQITRSKARLRIHYQSASSRFTMPDLPLGDLPDVLATSGTRHKLQLIVEECATQLDGYSRYLGRNPESPEALEGLLQLPTHLWPDTAKQALEDLKQRVCQQPLLLTLTELLAHLDQDTALPRDRLIALAEVLQAWHIGLEPDVRSGSRTPKPDDRLALFSSEPEEAAVTTTAGYAAAIVTLDLASAVAAADGNTSLDEVLALGSHIDSWGHLSLAQRKRLKAHLQLQLLQPPTLASLKKKLEPLSQPEKYTIVSFLTHLAQADGVVSPEEVRLLERVYKALQLDPQSLYSDLHGAAANTTAGGNVSSTKPDRAVVLDMDRIARLQRETAEVSALLAKVFDNEVQEEPEQTAQHQTSPPQSSLYGLDAGHSALLRQLATRPEWQRQELQHIADSLELMLDGALEQINEMAFDTFDMPFCEGDDPIEINPAILSELSL